ncbi:MAG: YraN family protein [Bacteroidales bacterium]
MIEEEKNEYNVYTLTRTELGKKAEKLALDFLEKKGFLLLEKNWRNRHQEVDLIMKYNGIIHFIEVRSLRSTKLHWPKETVLQKKQRNLIKAAQSYVYKKHIVNDLCFDIVSISFNHDKPIIEYVPDAFLPFC